MRLTISGVAASPGVADGPARVIADEDDLADVEAGEILVATITSPSFTPVFDHIAGVVTDRGGMLSHAAIVARELGLPAVVGTRDATAQLATGDLLRVDGTAGTVTVLDDGP